MSPSLMQRSTSYRKPVPEYVPSPPPSPLVASAPSNTQNENKELPPLPTNWRENLVAKIAEANASNKGFSSANSSPSDAVEPRRPDLTGSDSLSTYKSPNTQRYGSSFATLPGSQYSGVQPKPRRGLPRDYRPPTPPLHFKSQLPQLSVHPTPEGVDQGHHSDSYLSARSYPSKHHPQRHLAVYAPSGAGISLMTSTSFRTENTTVSLNPSVAWSRRIPNLSEKTMGDDLTIPDNMSTASGVMSCWNINLFGWLKKLRRLIVSNKY